MSQSAAFTPDIAAKSPPLVMLPGTLCDERVFAPIAAHSAMRKHHPVQTIPMTGQTNMTAMARQVLTSAPACFIPVGFSLGALVALELALLAPERVPGMVLIAGNARPVPVETQAERRALAQIDPELLISKILWPRYTAPARQQDDALRTLITDMARKAPPQTLAQQTELAITRSDKRPLLAAITMPVLVLGGWLDSIAPPDMQQELADGLPHATLRMASDAGHFLPLECPDFCALTLAEWLASTFALD